MGNTLFVVWRESAEAMLVVGILYAWLKRQPDASLGLRYLWGGVAAGIALALLLAGVMLGIATILSSEALDYFQTGMVLVASALIVQMVFWMRRHGRTFKKDLESDMQKNVGSANWWGMLVVVMLAVGRESAETVVFLYGIGMEGQDVPTFILVVALGVLAAYATFWLLQQGGKIFSWRSFFRFSEVLLLLLAGGLLVTGIDRLIASGALSGIVDPVWDTTALLDDSGRFGGVVSALTGYRARPSLLSVAALALYWVTVLLALRRYAAASRGHAGKPRPAPLRG